MPLAVMIYDLNHESEEYRDMTRGPMYRLALGEIYKKVRAKLKYETCDASEAVAYDQVMSWIGEACTDHEIDVP
jgi:hypothetical protein